MKIYNFVYLRALSNLAAKIFKSFFMSHFWGCISLSPDFNAISVSADMKISMEAFRADTHVYYESTDAVLSNELLFITPEASNYPHLCRNERFILVASCRLDNRTELAPKLGLSETHTDHQYLLAAYIAYGYNCVQHLVGDFSFVIWDTQQRTLFMAKDHLGIRPLFYYQDNEKLLFSTTIVAIKSVIKPVLNERYIATELKNYNPPFEETFFSNIIRLQPAHYLVANALNGQGKLEKYWELQPLDISAFKSTEAIYDELSRLFTQAVVCRTRTEKNVGCQLSGGLDSSAIAVLLSRNIRKERLFTYSFVLSEKTRQYSENGIDEQGTQQAVMDYAGLQIVNHRKIEDFHFKDVYEELEYTELVMGGYANSDCLWQDAIFKAGAADGVGVMMSGFPGDEGVSINGRQYFYEYLANWDWKGLGGFLAKKRLKGLKSIVGYYRAKIYGTYKPSYSSIQKKRNLLRVDSKWHQLLKDDSFKFYPSFKELFRTMICRPHTCLRTESEGAYAHMNGIETVYPLADIRLVGFVYSLPVHMFAPQKYSRTLFRNMCKGILPETVRIQSKFNGAMTLAFAEYWKKRRLKDFSGYLVTDALRVLIPESHLGSEEDMDLIGRRILYYTMDYHINKNKVAEEQAIG